MKIKDQDEHYIREIEISGNNTTTIFLAFTESGHSLDEYRYYSRDLTYTQAHELIKAIQEVMQPHVKTGDILTLQNPWEIGNGGPATLTIPPGMDFEVITVLESEIEIKCRDDDHPYNGFKMTIGIDDLEEFLRR